jgi:putative Mn2+ efflux pump MntP
MIFRLAFHFGFFQAAMSFLGWLAGTSLLAIIENFDHWLVFAVLCWLGVKMIIGGLNPEAQSSCIDPSRGKALVGICLATSIDALAAGITLAILNTSMVFALLMIGIASFVLAIIGLKAGNYLGKQFGNRKKFLEVLC